MHAFVLIANSVRVHFAHAFSADMSPQFPIDRGSKVLCTDFCDFTPVASHIRVLKPLGRLSEPIKVTIFNPNS